MPSGFTRWQFAFDPGTEPARFVRITATLLTTTFNGALGGNLHPILHENIIGHSC